MTYYRSLSRTKTSRGTGMESARVYSCEYRASNMWIRANPYITHYFSYGIRTGFFTGSSRNFINNHDLNEQNSFTHLLESINPESVEEVNPINHSAKIILKVKISSALQIFDIHHMRHSQSLILSFWKILSSILITSITVLCFFLYLCIYFHSLTFMGHYGPAILLSHQT